MLSNSKIHLKFPGGYNSLSYQTQTGRFFKIDKNHQIIQTYTCRDSFGWDFNKKVFFVGFQWHDLNVKKLVKFWEKRETELNLPADKQTQIFETNLDGAVVLQISDFWNNCSMRRSLFSLLLRLSAIYYSYNFKNSVEKYNLAAQCQKAIFWFFAGHTEKNFRNFRKRDSEGYVGFATTFKNVDEKYLEKMMVCPAK